MTEELIRQANAHDIEVDVLSFILTSPVNTDEVVRSVQAVADQWTTVVFTSMNAVEAVTNILNGERPDWKIYCIGETTGNIVNEYFGGHAIAGTAGNALALAAVIMLDGITEVTFFCGDQRRPELPDTLSQNNIKVEEVVVYRTEATAHVVSREYDGILFFSPSAVESFFSVNSIPNNTVLFAIGNTTGDAIKNFTNNPVITSVVPGKEALVQQAIEYFKSVRAER